MTSTKKASGVKRKRNDTKKKSVDQVATAAGTSSKSVSTEVGNIIRTHVKITYQEWSQVPDGLKETVWQEAKNKFKLTDDGMRTNVLQIAAERLRGFRTFLTSFYVFKTRKQRRQVPVDDPTTIYDGITKEDWELFKKQRMEEAFQEKSRKAKESQKHNVHPHYLGRSPYATKVPQWEKEEVEAILASNPEADVEATKKEVAKKFEDRSHPWTIAHTPPLSNPPPQTQEVIDNIKHYKELEKKGEFVPSGKEDVLVKATGKPEHPGRTRGVGSRVGNQAYFGKPSTRKEPRENLYTKDDVSKLKEELEKAAFEKVNELVNQRLEQVFKTLNVPIPQGLFKDSNTTVVPQIEGSGHSNEITMPSFEPNDPFMDLQDPVPCCLAINVNDSVIVVADGTAWPWKEGMSVHHQPLSRQNVRVSIDNVRAGKSSHPVPWDENVRVADVLGSFEQWPKKLVYLENSEGFMNDKANNNDSSCDDIDKGPKEKVEHEEAKQAMGCDNEKKINTMDKGKSKENVASTGAKKATTCVEADGEKDGPLDEDELLELSEHCERLERNICAAESGGLGMFTLIVSMLVYGYEEDVEYPLLFDDIRELFRYYCLNISVIQIWGSFLYEYITDFKDYQDEQENNLVGYLCPIKLCTLEHDPVGVEKWLSVALKAKQNSRYVLGAFRENYHWMLLVFEVGESTVYILDSAQQPKKKYAIRNILISAWKPYRFTAGRCHPYNKNLKVKVIKCPQQPGSFECGYYVMKWMWDISVRHSLSEKSLEECIIGPEEERMTITREQMNEVRELWALYVNKQI